ncbi:tripartite tricarboxylate transporter substrate binding protein [Candidimonas humi]|uniref:Bug family tripartite tricarboxylate transporter substrate binding protein n=1 Tax=Candidimonas humi TaxID=683355 RepID=A0ABV8P2A7_9BURK|nr:tripartite tricarboxylate transporter substrate binding protein [Candidimonas humi]MBV6306537.1 tripartite tricarboxylate transporter substrate binding protein [Candidimonas humi]
MRNILGGAVLALSCLPAIAATAAYPDPAKPIQFVVGFPAGSTIDNVSRLLLDNIRKRTGATIVVENKPGALGVIGLGQVAHAAPDGYTMMPSSSATNSSGPYLSKAFQRYDTVHGFTHVARVVRFDVAVVTNAAKQYSTAQALIGAAKAKPGALSSGYGSGTGRVAAAAFSRAAGINVVAVPYKGQPAAITDLLGGRIDFVAADLGSVLPQIHAKKLDAVALVADKRSTILPDVPTGKELGLADLNLVGWIGVSGPAKLPDPVVSWWAKQLKLAMADPDIGKRLLAIGMEPDVLTGPPLQDFVASQYKSWGTEIKNAGIKPE